ncbi:MAG: hypothetical protein ACOCW1_00935, partial [Chitinispirillaceae bacterium]
MMLWFPAFTVLASDDWSDFDEDLPSIYTEEESPHSTETEAASESDDYSADTYSETESAATEEDSAYGTDTESAYTAEEPAYGETESAAT